MSLTILRAEPGAVVRCRQARVEGRPLTDSELIEQAKGGDLAAYEELVRRYEQGAFRAAYLVCADADEARDAAQEGFVRGWRALGSFRSGAEPRPWLMRIVVNAARNRRRGSGRRANLALRVAQDRPSDGAAPSPEGAVLAAERRERLLAAVNQLGEVDRTVLGLRWFADLGEAEIAAALGVPRGTVKSRLSRAMGRLRLQLGEEERP
jgi:RNA polymerase sigma factor (sigma-70 family)